MASEPAEPTTRQEREMLEVIAERDRAEEWADRLAEALAPIEVRGEHSNGNDPWRNALEHAQRKSGLLADPAQTTELERLRTHVAKCHEFQNNAANILTAEQARLDEIRELLARPHPWTDTSLADIDRCNIKRIRAIIRRPTEVGGHPVPRCCSGPLADGTHAVNCWQRCQDCEGDAAGPRRCRCNDTATEDPKPRVWVHRAVDNPPRISPREAAETGVRLRNDTGHIWHCRDGAWQLEGKQAEQHGRDTRWGFWGLLEHCGRLTEVPPPPDPMSAGTPLRERHRLARNVKKGMEVQTSAGDWVEVIDAVHISAPLSVSRLDLADGTAVAVHPTTKIMSRRNGAR